MVIRRRDQQRGQALTELAISSVLLILILFGVVDFARVYNATTALQEAARVGARHGAFYDPSANVNPFLCDKTLANKCPSPSTTFASKDGIKDAVDKVLLGAGLRASQLNTGCPGTTTPYNPPFTTQFNAIGSTFNQPFLYVCYNTGAVSYSGSEKSTGAGGATGGSDTAPTSAQCGTACGGFDLEVVVVMKFSLVIVGELGPALPIAGNSHVLVQGT